MGVLMLGAGLQGTLLGLRATLEGFPTPVTGMIMSCYYVGYLLGTVAAPRLLRAEYRDDLQRAILQLAKSLQPFDDDGASYLLCDVNAPRSAATDTRAERRR